MGAADRVLGVRVRLSRRARPTGRYFSLSIILHAVLIAAALLLFGKPPDPPQPIEVTVILESGDETAGKLEGEKAEAAAPQQPAAAPQPTMVAPRPTPKPKAPPVKAAPPAPAKAAPVVRQVSTPPSETVPVVEQASVQATAPAASATANTGQAASGNATGTSSANGTGAGQQASATSGGGGGGGSGKASGGGTKGRSANDYLERVRSALARHKKYPDQARKLKQEGTVSISLHIARDGTVLGAQIAQASGFPLLDEAALQMARDASPLPRVPDDVDGESVRIALPISYSLGFFGRF